MPRACERALARTLGLATQTQDQATGKRGTEKTWESLTRIPRAAARIAEHKWIVTLSTSSSALKVSHGPGLAVITVDNNDIILHILPVLDSDTLGNRAVFCPLCPTSKRRAPSICRTYSLSSTRNTRSKLPISSIDSQPFQNNPFSLIAGAQHHLHTSHHFHHGLKTLLPISICAATDHCCYSGTSKGLRRVLIPPDQGVVRRYVTISTKLALTKRYKHLHFSFYTYCLYLGRRPANLHSLSPLFLF